MFRAAIVCMSDKGYRGRERISPLMLLKKFY